MSNDKPPREFWVEAGSFVYGCTETKEKLNGWKANGEGPWHVIEMQSYSDLKSALERERKAAEKLVEALEFYANKDNWAFTGSGLALHWRDKINNDYDREEVEYSKPHMVGGAIARQALQQYRKERGSHEQR